MIHTLKVACSLFFLAGKSNLGSLFTEKVGDFLIGDFANLVVMAHNLSILIADTTFSGLYHGVAGVVLCTNITVDSGPTLVAVARVSRSHWSVSTLC